MRRLLALLLVLPAVAQSRIDGAAAYDAFMAWRKSPDHRELKWEEAIAGYRARLTAAGLAETDVATTVSIIEARDEGEFYDSIYAGAIPKSPTAPNKLLVEAVANRKPGRALDVGMGQGRNAVYLAKAGWDVTGFDTSSEGLKLAREAAAAARVKIKAILASDQEFDFGRNEWDLIALIYPIEKRSVYRVRESLKPGGIVVLECSHKEGANAPFEYETDELPKIFSGFHILKYEDAVGEHEWARKRLRLVRLIAEKPLSAGNAARP